MAEHYIQIAEHRIQMIGESVQLNKLFYENFQLLQGSQKQQEPDLYLRVIGGFGAPFSSDHVEIDRKENQVLFQRTDYLLAVDEDFKHATIRAFDELALKHAFMNLYSSFLVHHQWGLLLHSCSVLDRGVAHLFAGHSGDGKSTAARLSFPRKLFADEASIVKIEQEQVKVFNSPFRSELTAVASQVTAELASIQILNQASQHQRIKISKADALFQLIDKVFFWSHSQAEIRKILQMLTTLVKKVPVYELYFQKNPAFWELISS